MNDYWNSMAQRGLVKPTQSQDVPAGTNDSQRRLCLRAIIDAIVARDIFKITREELEYILHTFPSVREKDIKKFGDYRTKELILTAFDSMEGFALEQVFLQLLSQVNA